MPARKLQIFISSTYEELRVERQAAVEAVLGSGHIPAGMELFATDDKSQWKVIERWIDSSDAFVLILGSRYGSVDAATGHSYVQLEYEYAISQGKPCFAVVMTNDEVRKRRVGVDTVAVTSQDRYDQFRETVLSRMCSHFRDTKDIELAIYKKMPELVEDARCVGWIYAKDAETPAEAAKRLAELQGENDKLRLQLERLQGDEETARRTRFLSADYVVHLITKHGIECDACIAAFRQARSIDDLAKRLRAVSPRDSKCEFLVPQYMQYEFLAMVNMARRALELDCFARDGRPDPNITDTYLGVSIHTKSGEDSANL